MSVISVIDAFPTSDGNGAGSYTVTRRAAPTTVAGRTVLGSTSTFNITASVQPHDGRNLRALPEGRHAEDIRIIYTAGAVRVGDTVAISAEAFEIYKVDGPWELDGDAHCRASAARQVIP
jgi:hypothetical protein